MHKAYSNMGSNKDPNRAQKQMNATQSSLDLARKTS